jgi:hypothetical protein
LVKILQEDASNKLEKAPIRYYKTDSSTSGTYSFGENLFKNYAVFHFLFEKYLKFRNGMKMF